MATVTIEFNQLPYNKSYRLKQGDGLEEAWHAKIKSEAATSYSDLNLTGCTLKLYISKNGTAVTGFSGTSVTPDVAAEGKFRVRIPAASTTSWLGEYAYELEVTFPEDHANFPDGCTKTFLQGRITVSADL